MIYITGDTHGHIDCHKLNTSNFPEQRELKKTDYAIVLGDFGFIWSNKNENKYWLKWLAEKNFTTLFVDGNHENFDLLNRYPVKNWHGGKVHQISESIFHLMRGQVFTIENKTFFTFGGAISIDKANRKEYISWWKEELPNYKEQEEGFENLLEYGCKIDYVLTHDCPGIIRDLMFRQLKVEPIDIEGDSIKIYLNTIFNIIEFKYWYFGHYHIDLKINSEQKSPEIRCFYDDILKIE
jgi:hypothetical protein